MLHSNLLDIVVASGQLVDKENGVAGSVALEEEDAAGISHTVLLLGNADRAAQTRGNHKITGGAGAVFDYGMISIVTRRIK